ncbi:MAG TPA: CHC2 zinc finger domain-containing protein [Anaerolineaceae bacterium]|nr:CHC2 zinc finger domain-containing protein [Anaerolineaceae bacterium]
MVDLEEIRSKVSLVALAEQAGAHFKDANHLVSHCPLPRHAGDRSSMAFTIYDNGRRWKCHSACPPDANGGDVIGFYMAWKGVDFKTALADLTERAGLKDERHLTQQLEPPSPAVQPLSSPVEPDPTWRNRAEQFIAYAEQSLTGASGAGARNYLEQERGLGPETWQAFRLGYNPGNFYDDPGRWGLTGKKIWLPRGIVIPGLLQAEPWYIKVRRALPGQSIGRYIGAWTEKDGLPEIKFGGPRGGKSVLFGQNQFAHLSVLLLVEGEWDAMLIWQWCHDFCDVGTLGGAQAQFDALDLAVLIRYQAILVVHDADAAGEKGRQYIAALNAQSGRVKPIPPPHLNGNTAHDLTDFWKAGGSLRAWAAGHIAQALDEMLEQVSACVTAPTIERWRRLATWVRQEADHV